MYWRRRRNRDGRRTPLRIKLALQEKFRICELKSKLIMNEYDDEKIDRSSIPSNLTI